MNKTITLPVPIDISTTLKVSGTKDNYINEDLKLNLEYNSIVVGSLGFTIYGSGSIDNVNSSTIMFETEEEAAEFALDFLKKSLSTKELSSHQKAEIINKLFN